MNMPINQNTVVRSDFPGNKVQNGKSKETNAHLNMIRHLGRVYFASVRLELLFLERKKKRFSYKGNKYLFFEMPT